jgi:hypothetical protein
MRSKTGRNDPCPCGSGQKYKRCCLARAEAARIALAQKQLFDAPEEASDDGDLDDFPPFDISRLTCVRYERGFVDTMQQLQEGTGLRATEWLAPAIPSAILDSIQHEALAELDGAWGDPAAGDPIQVDVIELHTHDDIIIVEMINRAIFLIHTDDEAVKSIHRVCATLEALAGSGVEASARPDPEFVPDPEDDALLTSRPAFDWEAVTKAHRHQPGRCELCGAGVTSAGASRHVAVCAAGHDDAKGAVQTLVRLRVTAPGLSGYWLEIEMRDDAKLDALDQFLRYIWLECCGHLSLFSIGGIDYGSRGTDLGFSGPFAAPRERRSMSARLREVLPRSDGRIVYEYDFGSTTRLKLDVKGTRGGRIGRQAVRLLARNAPLTWPCGVCGGRATLVCAYCRYDPGNPFVCEAHAEGHGCEEGEGLMSLVNSPRTGVCGYTIET